MEGVQTVFIIILCALIYYALVSSASKRAAKPPPPPGCDFCRDNSRIIAYRESSSRNLKVADFCPVCGRRLPTPPGGK